MLFGFTATTAPVSVTAEAGIVTTGTASGVPAAYGVATIVAVPTTV
jgi:hypothetical protein